MHQTAGEIMAASKRQIWKTYFFPSGCTDQQRTAA